MSDIDNAAAEQPAPQEQPPAPPAPRQTAAFWAEQKKIGRRVSPEADDGAEVTLRGHVLAGVVHHNRWPVGALLTEAEFDAGVDQYLKEPLR